MGLNADNGSGDWALFMTGETVGWILFSRNNLTLQRNVIDDASNCSVSISSGLKAEAPRLWEHQEGTQLISVS
jgi:hypothetical protein